MIGLGGLAAAILLSWGVIRLLRRHVRPPHPHLAVSVFGTYSPVLTWVSMSQSPRLPKWVIARLQPALQGRLGYALELILVGLWALWIGRNLLDFDPRVWPIGREFGIELYGFHFWDQVRQCGLCGLWNGLLNGGSPALADPFVGHLHPLAAAATLLAGVVNGAKVTIVASFFLVGVSQWWIGRAIGLGRWSRLWASLAAVSGAHLVAKVELGSVGDVLSIAASSLALASSFDLALHPSRKAALRFALLLGLALLAGRGYFQLALLAWLPWVLWLTFKREARPQRIWREFVIAGVLAVLIAGVLLVPLVHFWPEVAKHSDELFEASQPLEYIPLNLVIHDWAFLTASVLGKTPYPYLHTLYIGWMAVLLAIVGLARGRKDDRRLLLSFFLGALTMMWLASGVPFRSLVTVLPGLAQVRHIAHAAGFAVPAVLALAGYGLDRLLEYPWPRVRLGLSQRESENTVSFNLAWILAIPLLASLRVADQFDQNFMWTEDRRGVYQALQTLQGPGLEWISLPFGEHYWVEPGLAMGLKLTDVGTPWWWDGRELPGPRFEATRESRDSTVSVCCALNEVPVYEYPANEYAVVEGGGQTLPCPASGAGGDLSVACTSDGGTLTVRENAWAGWTATVNGQPVQLDPGPWLSVAVPAGAVEVRFRYLPWDVLLGVILTLMGVGLTIGLWVRANRQGNPTEE